MFKNGFNWFFVVLEDFNLILNVLVKELVLLLLPAIFEVLDKLNEKSTILEGDFSILS